MQTRQPSLERTGEVRLRRLVKEALRMRPDRIVGQIEGFETPATSRGGDRAAEARDDLADAWPPNASCSVSSFMGSADQPFGTGPAAMSEGSGTEAPQSCSTWAESIFEPRWTADAAFGRQLRVLIL